ncbi:MAG: glycosyltransferase family 2 protein [Exilispira sp.]
MINTKQRYFVSVIIPNFNRVESFYRAVNSVINQTYNDFEIIIIDDGSEKSILEKNRKFVDDLKKSHNNIPIIMLENFNNMGVSYSRNIGIKNAKGRFIALLDSDDEWLKNKLKIQIEYIKKTDFRVVHCEEIWIRNGVRVNPMKKHKKEGGDIFERSLELCLMSPSSVIIERTIFDQFGFFDESMPVCEDYDLWLRITSKEKVGFIEKPLIIKHGGNQDQLSRKYEAMDKYRVYSLLKLIENEDLNDYQKEKIKKTIIKKATILLNGAIKRGKINEANIYESWINKIT